MSQKILFAARVKDYEHRPWKPSDGQWARALGQKTFLGVKGEQLQPPQFQTAMMTQLPKGPFLFGVSYASLATGR